jgi:outer membrane protein assembly factor BamB
MPQSFRATALFVLGIPVGACASPSVDRPKPIEEAAPPTPAEDLRPEVGPARLGEDITDKVREQSRTEPRKPTRRGSVSPGMRPTVRRTEDGFVARLPGADKVLTPAYHRGKIYTAAFGTYEMHALEPETGKPLWSLHLSDDGPSDPACKDGVCVFNTYSCTTFAVDAKTGAQLWSWYLGSPQLATPVISGDKVYASYPGSGGPEPFVLAAFDLKTGVRRWARWIDAEVNSAPVAYGDHVYVATKAGTLYQFAAASGDVVSARQNRIAAPPVIAEGALVFPRDDHARPPSDAIASTRVLFPEVERPTLPTPPVTPKPRPLVARHRLVTIEDGALIATHRSTGERIWQHHIEGSQRPALVPEPLAYAGKSILMATTGGDVVRIDADTGSILSTFALREGALTSQPIAVGGWIYAGTSSGALVGFDTKDPTLTGWEMLGGGPERTGVANEEEEP